MVKVVWTERVQNGSRRYRRWTFQKIHFTMQKLTLIKLIETEINISDNPKIGRVVSEIKNENIREVIKGNYRIIYEIRKSNSVFILTVFHSARFLKEEDIN